MNTVSPRRRVTSFIAFIAVLLLAGVVWLNRWGVYDYFRLRNYQPSAPIAQLASNDTMNASTQRLFYVYHPDLEDKSTFSTHCKGSEKTIVLGCYVASQGIYLYNVTEPRLSGVVEVTAAHETLHAAYDRLSSSDKQRVDAMIVKAYAGVTDERIRGTITAYQKNGADTTNELHSILGTEVRNLPSDLEQYYARYFTNRKAIVTYSEKYEQEFTARKSQVAADDAKLGQLKAQIDTDQALLTSQEASLNTQREQLNTELAARNYQAYNAGVPAFNAAVNRYNGLVAEVRGLIDQYNTLVAQRNAIADEESQLVQAIDSRPNTINQQ